MGGRRIYNDKIFPPGTRVRVHAPSLMEGSDYEWHRHIGVLVSNGPWALVRMEKGVRHWPSNEVLICNHNLVAVPSPESTKP